MTMHKLLDMLINALPEKVSYKLLVSLQTVWPDFVDFSDFALSFIKKQSMTEV